MEIIFELLAGLIVCGLYYVFTKPRLEKMQDVLDEPETVAEQNARKQTPHVLRGLTVEEIKKGLRLDLKHAATYLQSAQGSLKRALSSFDVSYRDDNEIETRGPAESFTDVVFNDLLQVDQFLALVIHRMRLLKMESPERFDTDWSESDFFGGVDHGQLQFLKVCVDDLLDEVHGLEV